MLGFTIHSFDKLPINTPFIHNGYDMIKVHHHQYGFAARTGNGETVVLTGKTPVHVATKPTSNINTNAVALVAEVELVRKLRS